MAGIRINIDSRGAKQGSQEVNTALQSMATQAAKSVSEIDQLRAAFLRQEGIIKNLEGQLRSFGNAANVASTQANRGFASMGAAISRVHGVILSLGSIAALGGLTRLAKGALDTAGTLVDTADRIGITVEALQELQFAATQSGVSTETFAQGMEFFSVKLSEATRGTGDVSKILKQFGLDAKALSRDPAAALTQVADKIAGITNQARRLEVTREFFGRGASAMANMLQIGGPALDALRQKIRDLGGVMEEDIARNAEEMGDAFEAASQVIGIQFKSALIELAPFIIRTTQLLGDAARGVRDLARDIGLIGTPLKTKIQETAQAIFDTQQKLAQFQQDKQTGAGNIVSNMFGTTDRDIAFYTEKLTGLQKTLAGLEAEFRKTVPAAKQLTGEITGLTEAESKAGAEIDKFIQSTRVRAETMNLSGKALAEYVAKQKQAEGATAEQVKQVYAVVLAEEKAKEAKEAATKATQDAAEATREAARIEKEAAEDKEKTIALFKKMDNDLLQLRQKEDQANAASVAKMQEELAGLQEEGRLIQASLGPKSELVALEYEIGRARIERQAATERVAANEAELTLAEEESIEATRQQRIANLDAAASFDTMKQSIDDAALSTADLKSITSGILSGTQSIGDIFEDLGQTAGVRMVEGIMFGKGQNEQAILGNFNQLLGVDAAGLFGAQGMNLGNTLISSIQQPLASAGFDLGSLFGSATVDAAQVTWEAAAPDMFAAGGAPMTSAQTAGSGLGTIFGSAMAGAAGMALGKGLSSMFGIGGGGAGIGGTVGGIVGGIGGAFFGPLAAAAGGAFGSIFGSLIGSFFAHTPTRGTQIRKGVKDFLKDIEASFASEIDTGEYFFEATKKLAKKMFGGDGGEEFLAASKVILQDKIGPELSKQLSALGTFITADQAQKIGKSVEQTGTTFGNMLLDNLGLDPKEIQAAVDEIIQKSGVTLEMLTDKLTDLFETGAVSVEFYTDAIKGAVQIFSRELPAAINVATIAMNSFGEDGVFNLEKFTTALELTTSTFDVIVDSFLDVVRNSKAGEDIGKLLGEQITRGLEEVVVNQFLRDFVENRLFEGIDLANGLDADELALIQARAGQARIEVDKLRSSFEDVGDEVEDAQDKVENLFDTIRDLTNQRFQLRLDVISDLESIGAISGTAAAQARIGAFAPQVARFANPSGLGTVPLGGFGDLELEQGLVAVRGARQAAVDLFQAQEQAAQEALSNRVRDINTDYEARRKALQREGEAAQEASQARIAALGKERDAIQELYQMRIDGLQEELQIAQDFRQVAESLQETINGLVSSTSRFSGPEQLAIFQQQASVLRGRIAGASGSERAALIEELSQALTSQISTGAEIMSESAFRELFDTNVREIERLRDETMAQGDRVEQIQNAIASTTAQMEVQLRSIDAQIESAQASAQAAQRAAQDQAERLSEQEQAAIATAQNQTEQEVNRLRLEAVSEIQRLAVIEDQILAEQLVRAQVDAQLSAEQLSVLYAINSSITLLDSHIIGFLAGGAGKFQLPPISFDQGRIPVPNLPFGNQTPTTQFSPTVNITMNNQNGSGAIDVGQFARGFSQAVLGEWRDGQMGREIRSTIERKK